MTKKIKFYVLSYFSDVIDVPMVKSLDFVDVRNCLELSSGYLWLAKLQCVGLWVLLVHISELGLRSQLSIFLFIFRLKIWIVINQFKFFEFKWS